MLQVLDSDDLVSVRKSMFGRAWLTRFDPPHNYDKCCNNATIICAGLTRMTECQIIV